MQIEWAIINAVADEAANRLTCQIIQWLQTLPAELSGKGSGLKNVWEEICVQVQGEESLLWDAYKETVTNDFRAKLDQLKLHEQLALWLQTDSGLRWWDEYDEKQDNAATAPIDIEDVVLHLWGYAWKAADEYENRRIRRFLDDRYL